ncbi:MAG: hypothetical protein ACLRPW_09005 [Intestinibacter sp.]
MKTKFVIVNVEVCLLSELGKNLLVVEIKFYIHESYGIQESAKPFLAGFAEIELDKTTGSLK